VPGSNKAASRCQILPCTMPSVCMMQTWQPQPKDLHLQLLHSSDSLLRRHWLQAPHVLGCSIWLTVYEREQSCGPHCYGMPRQSPRLACRRCTTTWLTHSSAAGVAALPLQHLQQPAAA
jgi:hypothetical protein